MGNKRAILLLSGGIDSTTLLAKLSKENYEIIAISFDYGQKHNIEINYAKKNAIKYNVKKHHIIKLDKSLFNSSALVNNDIEIETYKNKKLPKGQVNAYVPFRNMLFISNALSLAETININEIYLAFNQDDSNNYWDCKSIFINKVNAVIALGGMIQIKTPFITLSKIEIIRLAYQLNVNIQETITCYSPIEGVECGVCLSCLTKQKAIKNA